jgi:hypothetical protein
MLVTTVSPNLCLLQRLYPPPKLVCHPSVTHSLTDKFTNDNRDTIYYTHLCNCSPNTYIHNVVTRICSFSPWINNPNFLFLRSTFLRNNFLRSNLSATQFSVHK